MGDPLIITPADQADIRRRIDNEAAVALLKERHPDAEVMAAKPPESHEFGEAYTRDWPDVVWLLDMGAESGSLVRKLHFVDPTADACVAMLVWRELHKCDDCGNDGSPLCPTCEGAGHHHPPTWLRVTDKAVRGVAMSEDEAAFWAWMRSYGEDWLTVARHCCGPEPSRGKLREGRAILRARKGWEAEIEELRKERNEFARTILRLEGELRELRAQLQASKDAHHRTQIDRAGILGENLCLRDKLREALDHLYYADATAAMSREKWLEWWRSACEIAQLDSPIDPP